MWAENSVAFSSLEGKTITTIEGAERGSDRIKIGCEDGSVYVMHHYRDCCESVLVEDVAGDPSELVGQEVLSAFESTNSEGDKPSEWAESWTWTFYTIRTMTDTVVIRWLGESNGYYSESVDFEEVTPPNDSTAP